MYRLQISRLRSAVVITAGGELDAYAEPELVSTLADVGAPLLVVDLSAVTFIDSTALGAISRAVRLRAEEDRRTAIVLPRGSARRIFEITGLDEALPVYASIVEALS